MLRTLFVLGLLSSIGYVLWVSFFTFNPDQERIVSSLLFIGLALLFSCFCWRLAKSEKHPRTKNCWRLLAIAGLSNTMGEAIWFYHETFLKTEPFVTAGDVFYALFYPLILVGILLLPHAPSKKEARTVLFLDLAIVMTTSLMLFWYFILFPLSLNLTEDLRVMLATYYPVSGFLVLSALIALLERNVEGVKLGTLLFLALGIVFNVTGDTLFAYCAVNKIDYDNQNLNLLYLAGAILLLLAVVQQRYYTEKLNNHQHLARMNEHFKFLRGILPYISTIAVFILLAFLLSSAAPRVVGILLGILCLLGLVFLRQYVVLQENIRLYQEMQRIAVTDELTGLSTRRFVKDTLNIELIRSQRYGRNLTILLMDLDHFKKYNDSFGHLEGDAVLKKVAKVIATQLRATDMIGRYGGDEFLAVLPETDHGGAELVAAKIKSAVRALSSTEMFLGITIGIASFSSGKSANNLVEEADRDLYRQKHSRRLSLA